MKNIGAGIATNDKPKTMEHPNSRLTISGGHVPKGIPLPEGVTLNKKVFFFFPLFFKLIPFLSVK